MWLGSREAKRSEKTPGAHLGRSSYSWEKCRGWLDNQHYRNSRIVSFLNGLPEFSLE